MNSVVKAVAAGLRNTPGVCRKSYINPAVFDAWQNGKLHGGARSGPSRALLSLLRRQR
jgi:DNA topoisomerase I